MSNRSGDWDLGSVSIHNLINTKCQITKRNWKNTISCLMVRKGLGHLEYSMLFSVALTVILEWVYFAHNIYCSPYFCT